ncbi:MAG: hypothetical protein FJW30_22125 [Acidobacteria bacterium]|nr:hypothetical protein [Acidobacteriota bacterium]
MNSRALVCLCYAAVSALSEARTRPALCGTYPGRWLEEQDLHAKSMRRQSAVAAPRKRADIDIGHIAVLESDPSIFTRRNPFNLVRLQVVFEPDGAGYRYTTSEGGYDAALADAGTPVTGIGDDDTRLTALPFAFPFFGESYREVFLNSDGNLTFTASDVDTTARSVGRMLAGPPRLSPLFTDLDPSRGGSIRVHSTAERVVFTWQAVPEFADFGTGPRQTFQIQLFPNGRIVMAWEAVAIGDAVVGIAPGNDGPRPVFASFAANRSGSAPGMLAERFGDTEELDVVSAARRFYQSHDDAYDYLAFFNAAGISIGGNVLAFESTVRSSRRGIGDTAIDAGRQYGSANRLQAVLNMGPLSNYPANPADRFPLRGNTGDTGLTVLAHEIGHLFLAFVSVPDSSGGSGRPMLGRQGFHWNFRFNSEASILEGNRIRDNGESASPRFTTVATVEEFSPLDQYLMGLRAPDEVPATFLVENASLSPGVVDPSVGVSFNGVRRNVTVDDIVAAHGRRTPDHTVEQRRFRIGFVLITPEGTAARSADIEKLERYRGELEASYGRFTSGRGAMEATLLRNVRLSVEPAAGALLGNPVTVRAALDAPAAEALTFRLTAESGVLEAPASVVIPAGAREASFTLRPLRAGVETLRLSAPRYLTVEARVRVAERAASIRLVSGDNQPANAGQRLPAPIVVKITDENELPYPGVPLTATPSAGGSVTPAMAMTGADGTAQFVWTPSSNPGNTLRVAVSGSSQPFAEAVALARPAFSVAGVVNAASFRPGLSPGGIATIFGSNLREARVFVDGQPATVFFSSNNQINFLTPELATLAAIATVRAENAIGPSETVTVPFASVQPGLFFDTASGLAAAIPRGERIFELYATGLGPSVQIGVTVGGRPATILYAGIAPGFAGLQQINCRASAELAAGLHPVAISANGISSNEARLRVE